MVDKKIYNGWAYRENETEKGYMNSKIYEELQDQYRIARSTEIYNRQKNCFEKINFDEYDIIIESSGVGYGHCLYRVIKNEPELTYDQLALICDEGNLCFGYGIRSGKICIYTD